MQALGQRNLADHFGICQWFHYEAHDDLLRAIELLDELGIRHLRTGVSWADYHRPHGKAWYDHLFDTLGQTNLELLVSVWHTPPSIAEGRRCNGPPRRLRDFADFIDRLISEYGEHFHSIELWNEPNNRLKWNFEEFDPDWQKFGAMVRDGANWARTCGKETVLGGMIPIDPHWLNLIKKSGAFEFMDVIAIHGFPQMWWEDAPNWDWHSHWHGWPNRLEYISGHCEGKPVWITETGLATWDHKLRKPARHDLQTMLLRDAASAPSPRVYWYSLIDLHPSRAAIEGYHVEENEYHLGLVTCDLQRKPAFSCLKEMLRVSASTCRSRMPQQRGGAST